MCADLGKRLDGEVVAKMSQNIKLYNIKIDTSVIFWISFTIMT